MRILGRLTDVEAILAAKRPCTLRSTQRRKFVLSEVAGSLFGRWYSPSTGGRGGAAGELWSRLSPFRADFNFGYPPPPSPLFKLTYITGYFWMLLPNTQCDERATATVTWCSMLCGRGTLCTSSLKPVPSEMVILTTTRYLGTGSRQM